MRRGKHRKFARQTVQRKALYKALATALIEHGKIRTTLAKAKSLSQFTDKMITRAKKGDLASRRLIGHYLGEKATKKLISELGPKFKDQSGGYTKVLRLGRRISDGAEMAIIKFTS
ncbi:MAG: 50S ribosomal protein L17 [Candidatus Yanofskybacteria bacterium RIFCSPHIGHO2_02_FULL_41_29]|uniref:50S ribosomal protein L17 n=1 Tax=Candidatus Yanofskybacteria bacterium RIFCSPHIGHO2_01_FULL_41_53 TaxID=1802663 RepID=A0A1F8EI24_9BACT|nr:MAG: 50S ribosomal protein L17 [Candidatus Yanofskybacteria bacterium RIFCSPHIGHO2_01_FULL_41_53]OGN11760.1 MAG: 50S ribosomal protein L17 [Candidatus Yanofskybacteria bacterium RIFCSPHIGHO2_02_FULL_41_29]OGN18865.1 MAG: 50S ribosomal protein L17 [Candidatus Yanofskybacteria bacterium RIFCSPHIGHO2_12_FULL_41_9]OGN22914.1 MAG: 50S ribosomal protein L17 [Candidatus Yanofskybacteria bacterium RIFCSPLOWO2_01_FULL_41_67]OGN30191.1 MAG: 50S ribosomal protein L17 [Candidatus Yanofskybacteria bacter